MFTTQLFVCEMLAGVSLLILAAVSVALVSVGVYYGAKPVKMGSSVKMSNVDSSSFSNPDEAIVKSLHLSLEVKFEDRILTGEARLKIEKKREDVEVVALDVSQLHIKRVTDFSTGLQLEYTISEPVKVFGSKMEIVLPKGKTLVEISIKYKTDPEATALQWLRPEQTAGGKYPYLFSQCQPIHCRSIVPIQDTPYVKFPYSAVIVAPGNLMVLMSAIRGGGPVSLGIPHIFGIKSDFNLSAHTFEQKVPIPSYLIAIAVGDLHSKEIGPRSRVWSEKELVDQAAYEFAETEQMLSIAEEICGEYVWGVYDLLVLPPSFPFGGMENPCLTFVTPTLLAGDRSLACVVAHEISHSWTGNLVTNMNFDHFWLNEGFTMFVERKIKGRMFGESMREFSAINGLKDLKYAVDTLGKDNPLTKLVVDLSGGISPDDAFSTCPYEKGHTFLFYLEQLVGGPEVFEPFLKAYLNIYKFKSIETEDFKAFFENYFANNEEIRKVDWDAWLNTPGMPVVIPEYDSTLADICADLAQKWIKWNVTEVEPFKLEDIKDMKPLQVQDFLAQLLEEETFPLEKVKVMQDIYKFDEVKNSEIKFRWLRLCLKAKWEEQVIPALKFATEQGRMKFVRPIFRSLYAWEEMRQQAIDAYEAHKANMMHVSARNIAHDLHLEDD